MAVRAFFVPDRRRTVSAEAAKPAGTVYRPDPVGDDELRRGKHAVVSSFIRRTKTARPTVAASRRADYGTTVRALWSPEVPTRSEWLRPLTNCCPSPET